MDSAVNTHQKSLQRPHTHENLNGPRVSFNKDVHVKRIGGRSNENNNNNYGLNGDDYPVPSSQQPQVKRELPSDLSKEELIKEAEKVIAQTERIKCTVDTPNSLAGIRLQEKLSEDRKFNSLPHRKKKSSKPLGRSVSDASSQKKPKRASIFNLFSKRSDPNLSTVSGGGTSSESPRSGKRTGKPVGRSKSDVGYQSTPSTAANNNSFGKSQTLDRKRIKIPDNDESMSKAKKKSQLSPISENPPGEKLFGFTPDERKLLHYTKSEEKRFHEPMQSDHNDYDDDEPIKLTSNKPIRANHSRSLDSLHSSQLPQEKLPLTKGLKVDGMVKRLSMDRFSPPLHFNSPAFSYTRPAEPSIVYAQVRRDENGDKAKTSPNEHLPSTIHRSTNSMTRDRSPIRNVFNADTVDNGFNHSSPTQRQTLSTKFLNEKNRELHGNNNNNNNNYRKSPVHLNGDRHPTEYIHRIHLSDEDEGLGFDDRKRFDDHMTPVRDNASRRSSSEPPIIPTLRPSYGSIEHLANRRKLLESKIHERTFDFGRDPTPKTKLPTKPISPLNDEHDFHEINIRTFDEHFPEQNIVPSPRKQWSKQPKYYPETNLNDEFLSDIDTLRREQERQRHKTFLDRKLNEISTPKSNEHVIDLGYIDQYNNNTNTKFMNNNNGKIINQNLNQKHRKGRAPQPNKLANGTTTHHITIESNRRKLDKADSGIEHDFKRDRGRDHGDNNNSRFRRLHPSDDIKEITELFLKRECQLSESLHPSKKRYEFVFRERSIDDGSHFDPRLDKYPEKSKNQGTLTHSKPSDTKKSDKKFNSLKKVKELFSISSKKKSPPPPSIKSVSSQKHSDVEIFNPQSVPPSSPPPQQSYAIDIATRRRLSTPKASPIPKRIPSQKSSKVSHISSHRSSDVSTKPTPKTSWFKSLERLSRKNKVSEPKKPPSSIKRSNTTLSRPTYQRAQSPSPDFKPTKNPPNLRFFGDTDLESLSKAATTTRKREPLNTNNSQSLQNLRSNRSTNSRVDSDGSQKVRGASSMQSLHRDVRSKYLPELSESTSENENINGDHKSHAIRIHHSTPNNKHKSRQYRSMEYLENEKSSDPNRSDVSQRASRRPSRDFSQENSLYNERNAELLHRSALRERNGRSNSETRHLPPKGPTKPAREMERRRALSNDRFLESSGTEGDSSQQSVVYLHATTIGHIPQPYVASSRRSSKSRDELSSIKSKASSPMQPMTRTVSRSVSMLAPWTPRHISDGYEINYSQTMQNPKKKSSTMTRDTRGNHIQSRSKEDLTSVRSSSQARTTTLPKHRK